MKFLNLNTFCLDPLEAFWANLTLNSLCSWLYLADTLRTMDHSPLVKNYCTMYIVQYNMFTTTQERKCTENISNKEIRRTRKPNDWPSGVKSFCFIDVSSSYLVNFVPIFSMIPNASICCTLRSSSFENTFFLLKAHILCYSDMKGIKTYCCWLSKDDLCSYLKSRVAW